MADQDDAVDLGTEDCLQALGIDQLCQWDVLVFLHRHHASLAGAEQIAHLLGYTVAAVMETLSRLEHLMLAKRSRASQGVRLYEFRGPGDPRGDQILDHLLKMADHRQGRLEMMDILRRDGNRPQITGPRPGGGGGRPWLKLT
ncbi:hypothetical protein [Paludisphaera mucosa]|uniref:HTH marR-type domain-containing protein n=1 Tax=Paludisphaera mucosa TaxID=3030827 RepID=A0ABT6F9G9_9BACT|nr:hypothetical protein [Paludisphaera mucosa]MDG3004231.1 hypothetical protein [Paludisphaera mucosa]